MLASVQGRTAAEIAQMFAATDGYVREVIPAFNDTGFATLVCPAMAVAVGFAGRCWEGVL